MCNIDRDIFLLPEVLSLFSLRSKALLVISKRASRGEETALAEALAGLSGDSERSDRESSSADLGRRLGITR